MKPYDLAIQDAADQLKQLSVKLNHEAAAARASKDYTAAEALDRRAEALLCSAAIAETRGMQS